MDVVDIARTLAALGITLGLVLAAAWGFRRFAPDVMKRLQAQPGSTRRRLSVIETLVLGPQQRLVLVSLDGAERLVLLGGGQMLDPPKGSPRKTAP